MILRRCGVIILTAARHGIFVKGVCKVFCKIADTPIDENSRLCYAMNSFGQKGLA